MPQPESDITIIHWKRIVAHFAGWLTRCVLEALIISGILLMLSGCAIVCPSMDDNCWFVKNVLGG